MEITTLFKESSNMKNYSQLMDSVFCLRHETFVKRLDWDINSTNGREKDEFDDMESYHIAIANNDLEVEGCWRALPTTGPYMLEMIFPELLQGEEAPKTKNVWEISRFAVKKGSAKEKRGYLNNITISLINSFWKFAKENDVEHYVTVTTVACERILHQAGVTTHRMGAGRAIRIGKELSVALWIDVNNHLATTQH